MGVVMEPFVMGLAGNANGFGRLGGGKGEGKGGEELSFFGCGQSGHGGIIARGWGGVKGQLYDNSVKLGGGVKSELVVLKVGKLL